MKSNLSLVLIGLFATALYAADAPSAPAGHKVEKPVVFIPAKDDPNIGDWQGTGDLVAQVYRGADGKYAANLLKAFDTENNVAARLKSADDALAFAGEGWTATIKDSHLVAEKGSDKLDLQRIERKSPTLGVTPPPGAVVLFDGHNLDAWAKKAGKDWLKEDGPAQWKIVDGTMEVVPGTDCIITHQKFGDCHVHVEFRTLGYPTNSGVFLEDRYEANINETYGVLDKEANGGFDNCTENAKPKIRPCYPPLAWQTFDIDFHAPTFGAYGKKSGPARATVLFNGVKIYDNQALDLPHGAAARLGEAPTGPIMLQEHGMPLQFRNIWVVEGSAQAAAR